MYGDGKTADHPDMAGKLAGEVFGQIDEGVKRFEAAKAFLASQPSTDAERIAAIGYCFGGGIVLHMARIGMGLDLGRPVSSDDGADNRRLEDHRNGGGDGGRGYHRTWRRSSTWRWRKADSRWIQHGQSCIGSGW
jgi:dienelactone hydrolase